jgi:hypothetical protein
LGGIAETIPPIFFAAMSAIPRNLIGACVSVLVVSTALIEAAAPGFLEGHLKIISPREVELADQTPSELAAVHYADYPLIILSRDGRTEIARVTADENGNYRVALPAGDYILDVQGRRPKGHIRAKPQPFTVVANQTVRVDKAIDTGVR